MNIHVTAEDIATGVRLDPRNCAIALAINREIPGEAEVRAGCITLHGGSAPVEVETPFITGDLSKRIFEIDAGRGVPFSFALTMSQERGYVYSDVLEPIPEAARA